MRRYLGKTGFTLLELIIVIIIIGVLATLGFTQYGRIVEKSRGAEARNIIGDMRKMAYACYVQHGNDMTLCGDDDLNLGTGLDEIPTACHGTHYFKYAKTIGASGYTLTATRCIAGEAGKLPVGPDAKTVQLVGDFVTGDDVWSGWY